MTNIYIIGCGGIGSNLAKPLAKFMKYHRESNSISDPLYFYIVDGDKVENSNLSRQAFIESDIGAYKAQITTDDLSASIPSPNVIYIPKNVYLKKDNIDMIADNSLVLVGVDNYITRRIIESRTKRLRNVHVVFGANEYHDGDVNILAKIKGRYTTPLLTEKHPEVLVKDRFPDEIGCEEAQVSEPQIVPTNMMVASLMLGSVYSIIQNTRKHHQIFFDIKHGAVRYV